MTPEVFWARILVRYEAHPNGVKMGAAKPPAMGFLWNPYSLIYGQILVPDPIFVAAGYLCVIIKYIWQMAILDPPYVNYLDPEFGGIIWSILKKIAEISQTLARLALKLQID